MKTTTLFLAATFLSLTVLPTAQAQEKWQLKPRIELGYTYDDNYRLELPGNEIDVSGGILDAQVELFSDGPLSDWSLTPRVRTDYFPDEPEEESTDYYLTYNFKHTRQRALTMFDVRYAHESVVRSEAPDVDVDLGLGEGGGPDAGRLSVRNDRQLIDFVPSFHYAFSERRGFDLGASFRDVEFEDTAFEQVSYREYGARTGFSFAQSQRTDLKLQALASRYEPETDSNEATAYGAQAEWSTAATETTRTYIRVGAQRTNIDRRSLTGSGERSKTGYIAGVGGQWAGQLYSSLIDLTRNIGPTSSGFVIERDQLRLRVARRLSERAEFFVGLRGIRDNALESDVNYAERRYANGAVGFEWRIKRQFAIAANYDYTWQEFDDEPEARKSNGATLSFVYEPQRKD